jgi:acetyl-CoA carboxylase biotin carboxylase subunit
LAEQPELAETCQEYGVIFIGPSPKNLREMGNKLFARNIVTECGIATIPGSEKIGDYKQAQSLSAEVGYPIILKAAAGGGGRGMVIVKDSSELKSIFDTLSAEVQAAFGDGTLYVEHFIPNARHIEVQILGDRNGNVIHIGERDCSIQRRYQKVIEEAPSPAVSSNLRERITKAAVKIAKKINYENAGTVEFLINRDSKEFYFLEMNTRIQVEHPVTEEISGVDLVKEQIRIADHQGISLSQEEVILNGNAIECRINAENPELGFQPGPGVIQEWSPPAGSNIRVDSHCYSGYHVPPYYDSLLAKLIVSGSDRPEAIERMAYALDNFKVKGVTTTIPFLSSMIIHPDFSEGNTNSRWLEEVILAKGV